MTQLEPPLERPTFRPKAVAARSAADQIAAQLRVALIDGSLRPGDRLGTEPDLAEEFGVSRATVREAIKVLRTQGVLRTARGARGGHFVVSPQPEVLAEAVGDTFALWFDAGDVTVAEVDEARFVVERACVVLGAQRRTDDEIARLYAALDGAADPSLSFAEFHAHDARFHETIGHAARNRLLELTLGAIHKVRPRTNVGTRQHDRPTTLAQHRAIADAIAKGDPDGAAAAFDVHAAFLTEQRAAAAEAGRDGGTDPGENDPL